MKTLNSRKLYDISAPNQSTSLINGQSSNVLNWNDVRYDWAYPMYKRMLANFWISDEINMLDDVQQWNDANIMSDKEKEVFKKIIGLLAFLDSIQTDYSSKAAEFLTDSSVNALMQILSFQEIIHNQSYSYVLASLVDKAEQDEIFEYWKNDEVLLERNQFIADGYEEFVNDPTPESFLKSIVYDVVLEGLFFYSGFAFFYDLARQGKMTKTSQMINFINRDELWHVDLFTKIYKIIRAENPELDTPEMDKFTLETIEKAIELEIKWGNYLIGNDFEGIDCETLADYVKFRANQRCTQLNLPKPYPEIRTNPMKWIKYFENIDDAKQDFFEGKSRQYAKVDSDNGFDDL